MNCSCKSLEANCYALPSEFEFVKSFVQIEVDAPNWRHLYKCPECNQGWVVEHDKIMNRYGLRAAFKVESQHGWKDHNFQSRKIELKTKAAGGKSGKVCLMKNCSEYSLSGKYFCAIHS